MKVRTSSGQENQQSAKNSTMLTAKTAAERRQFRTGK
jgi:hypothetical protein